MPRFPVRVAGFYGARIDSKRNRGSRDISQIRENCFACLVRRRSARGVAVIAGDVSVTEFVGDVSPLRTVGLLRKCGWAKNDPL